MMSKEERRNDELCNSDVFKFGETETSALKLSDRDREVFLALLNSPPELNDDLRKAVDRYRK